MKLTRKQFETLFFFLLTIIVIIGAMFLAHCIFTGKLLPATSRIRGLFLKHTKTGFFLFFFIFCFYLFFFFIFFLFLFFFFFFSFLFLIFFLFLLFFNFIFFFLFSFLPSFFLPFLSSLLLKFKIKIGNPLVDSVAEHKATHSSAYMNYFGVVSFLAPLGFAISLFCFPFSGFNLFFLLCNFFYI